MDHFEIILSLSRAAIGGNTSQATFQIERLHAATMESGDKKQATKLKRLLNRKEKQQEVAPMSLERMLSNTTVFELAGEPLTRKTPLPSDKETGTPLVRVTYPDQQAHLLAPILGDELREAMDDLISEWARSQELAALGVHPNVRCLLYGKPGVGKRCLLNI